MDKTDKSLIINLSDLDFAFSCGFLSFLGLIMTDMNDMSWNSKIKLCTGAGLMSMGSYMSIKLLSILIKK